MRKGKIRIKSDGLATDRTSETNQSAPNALDGPFNDNQEPTLPIGVNFEKTGFNMATRARRKDMRRDFILFYIVLICFNVLVCRYRWHHFNYWAG